MPIYEYQCRKCGVFEVTQRITESPLKKCPTCRGKVERLISRGSFILKGSGWYATDYAKKDTSVGKDTTAPAANGAASTSDTKPAASESASAAGDAKPAATTPSSDKPAAKSGATKTAAA